MTEEFDPYKVRIKGVLVDPCAIGEAYKMSPTLFQSVKKLLMDDNPELEDFFDKVKKEIEESHFR
jgi:hypothetical protein